MTMQEFLRRLESGEHIDDLIVEAREDENVREAKANLEDVIDDYADDMTGQDGEEAINQAASDLIAARDNKLRREDPDSYHERKALGEI
jgi:hypothetical protein